MSGKRRTYALPALQQPRHNRQNCTFVFSFKHPYINRMNFSATIPAFDGTRKYTKYINQTRGMKISIKRKNRKQNDKQAAPLTKN